MTRLDPIIAVKNVAISSVWYQKVFSFKKNHGGDNFSVLVSQDNEIILCLHKWAEHEHPSLADLTVKAGNGLLLYFRTDDINTVYQNAIGEGCLIAEDIHTNPNSLHKEFFFRDPDGYFLTVSEFHKYE